MHTYFFNFDDSIQLFNNFNIDHVVDYFLQKMSSFYDQSVCGFSLAKIIFINAFINTSCKEFIIVRKIKFYLLPGIETG